MSEEQDLNQKNFGKIFVRELHLSEKQINNNEFVEIEKNIESDLFSNIRGYFSDEDLKKVMEIMIKRMLDLRKENPSALWETLWHQVVEEYHRSKYWGISLKLGNAPKVPLTQEQKNQWELLTYIWALIQSTIILKFVIYYFGIRAAEDQDAELKMYMYIFIFLSFFSLFHFAYRKWRKENKDSET